MWSLVPAEHIHVSGGVFVCFWVGGCTIRGLACFPDEMTCSTHFSKLSPRYLWHAQVNLEKVQERWWDAVFVDEPKLNVRAMECSRPMTDLDDEAQAKIEQMMWDDHRKKLGLPTSEQIVSEAKSVQDWQGGLGGHKVSMLNDIVKRVLLFQKMEGMLKKAWDAEGSPFRGQPFDPSKVNLQSGGDTFPPSMNQ